MVTYCGKQRRRNSRHGSILGHRLLRFAFCLVGLFMIDCAIASFARPAFGKESGKEPASGKESDKGSASAKESDKRSAAAKDAECLLDLDQLQPMLVAAPDKVRVALLRSTRSLEERLTLDSGIRLLYTQGGCVHYGYSFRFSGLALPEADPQSSAEVRSLLRQTERLLAGISLRPLGGEPGPPWILGPLRKELAAPKPGLQLPCQDAYCEVRIDRLVRPPELVVLYDFAL